MDDDSSCLDQTEGEIIPDFSSMSLPGITQGDPQDEPGCQEGTSQGSADLRTPGLAAMVANWHFDDLAPLPGSLDNHFRWPAKGHFFHIQLL
jgi:hypothetical protein